MLTTYTSYRMISSDIERSIDRVEKQPMVDRETDYYLDNIGKVKSIEEFVGNDRLFRYAMKAHGLEDMTYAKAFMIKALKEGVSKPDSFANKLTDKRYADFVTTYNFEKYGENATVYSRATHDAPANFSTNVSIGTLHSAFDFVENEVGYYVSNISNVSSIDDLLADSRLLHVAMGAFGLDSAEESPARVREMLEGGVTDPQSPANKLLDKRYANFVAAFNFVENGAAATKSDAAQNAAKQFVLNTDLDLVRPSPEFVKAEVDYYKANIGKVKSINDLLRDQRLLRTAMSAYGLDADTEDQKTIRTMLAGGVSSPDSPANKLTDKRYAAFVAAFDFATHGSATTARDAVQKDTLKLYTVKAESGLLASAKYFVDTETSYYLSKVSKIESIDDMMADKRLLNFALTAYGLDPAAEKPETIRKLLEGGISDPDSPANKSTDKRYKAFVTAFNFVEHGEHATTYNRAQEPAVGQYLRQTLEEQAGQSNEGVRLALYFERKAEKLNSFYDVLADPALSRVVRTALGLPESLARSDIDKQVALMEKRLDLKDLQDPEKLEKFMTRFTSLWEISNPSAGSSSSSIGVLFGQPASMGISMDLLFAIQSLRR